MIMITDTDNDYGIPQSEHNLHKMSEMEEVIVLNITNITRKQYPK